MARLPRLALAGQAHLVLLRAAPGQALFVDDADRRVFMTALLEALRQRHAALHAYALHPGHVHLLVTPSTDAGLGLVIQDLGRRYVALFNHRHGRRGSLWQGRFRAAIVEPGARLLEALLYIDAPAQRGDDPAAPGPWSSARHHLGLARDPLLTDSSAYWQLGNTPFDREHAYRRLLAEALADARTEHLAEASHNGWPIGGAAFLAQLAAGSARPVVPRRRGRPPRKR